MEKNLDNISNEAVKVKPNPFYLFYGKNEMGVLRAVRKLVGILFPDEDERALCFEEIEVRKTGSDLEKEDFQQVLNALAMYPPPGMRRVVWVRLPLPREEARGKWDDLTRSQKRWERLLETVLHEVPPEVIVLFSMAGAVPPKLFIEKIKMAGGPTLDFQDGAQFVSNMEIALKKRVEEEGKEITATALQNLVNFADQHEGSLYGEIEKLLAYTKDKRQIDESDVWELKSDTLVERDDDIFSLLNSLGERDVSGSLKFLDRLLREGKDTIWILNRITSHFRLLTQAKLTHQEKFGADPEDLPQEKKHNLFKQHPFVKSKALRQARNFELQELKTFMQKLHHSDLSLKSIDTHFKALSLEKLIVEICKV